MLVTFGGKDASASPDGCSQATLNLGPANVKNASADRTAPLYSPGAENETYTIDTASVATRASACKPRSDAAAECIRHRQPQLVPQRSSGRPSSAECNGAPHRSLRRAPHRR